jgi:hypothetical protein
MNRQATGLFRLFVSSPFKDLQHERNALHTDVFPRLRRLCSARGFRFQAIDLRWGIDDRASIGHKVMPICLQEIRRCQSTTARPNFMILLGERYGWRPVPYRIEGTEFESLCGAMDSDAKREANSRYHLDRNAVPQSYFLNPEPLTDPDERGLRSALLRAARRVALPAEATLKYEASATEQESECGAFSVPDAAEHVFCAFRRIRNVAVAREYIDLDENGCWDRDAYERLERLRQRLTERMRQNVHSYNASYRAGSISLVHLRRLVSNAYDWLSGVISREMDCLANVEASEGQWHSDYGALRSRVFFGRQVQERAVLDYVRSASVRPMAVFGVPGSGKTSLAARCAERVKAEHPSAVIVQRYIGVTAGSTEPRLLVEGMMREVADLCRMPGPPPSGDFQELCQRFAESLQLATAKRPLIVVVDGLEQFASRDHVRNLVWVPSLLPEHSSLIVTTSSKSCLHALGPRIPDTNLVRMEPMARAEGTAALNAWLAEAGRDLTDRQRKYVLACFARSGMPLYLRLAFEHSREWRDSQEPFLEGDVDRLIGSLLDRLISSHYHSALLVGRALAYLGASRTGLLEDELVEQLSRDRSLLQDLQGHYALPDPQLPPAVWSRLYFDLEPFLAKRQVRGGEALTFFHSQFGTVIADRFLQGNDGYMRHREIEDYFAESALYDEASHAPNVRKLHELPFQQSHRREASEAAAALTAPEFLEAKSAAGMHAELLADCDRLIERHVPEIDSVQGAIFKTIWALTDRPEYSLQTLTNRLEWSRGTGPLICSAVDSGLAILDRRGPWIHAVGPAPADSGEAEFSFAYEFPSLVQAISPTSSLVAVANRSGDVLVYRAETGELIRRHASNVPGIRGISINDSGTLLAWLDQAGCIRGDAGAAPFRGRTDQPRLLTGAADVFAVRDDSALVRWRPATDDCQVLMAVVPEPLVAAGIDPRDESLLYAGGDSSGKIVVVTPRPEPYTVQLECRRGSVADADLDSEAGLVLLGCRDRTLRLVDMKDGNEVDSVAYEVFSGGRIIGALERCALVRGTGLAVLATDKGHVGLWSWKNNEIRRAGMSGLVGDRVVALRPLAAGSILICTAVGAAIYAAGREDKIEPAHLGEVTGLALTTSGRIVSFSSVDKRLVWHSPTSVSPVNSRQITDPTALAAKPHAEAVVLGNAAGAVWEESEGVPSPDPTQIPVYLPGAVVALCALDDGRAVAAASSGTIVAITPTTQQFSFVRRATGFLNQRHILPAGRRGLCYSIHSEAGLRRSRDTISLVGPAGRARTVYRGIVAACAVSADGRLLSVADADQVHILLPGWLRSRILYTRNVQVTHLAFLCSGSLLLTAERGSRWMEVWQIADGLPTIAAIDLPESPACITAAGCWIAAGLRSGHVLGFHLRSWREVRQ